MNRTGFRRVLATLGALLAISDACLRVWWFYGFTQVYFPQSTLAQELPGIAVRVVAFGYCVAVSSTGRWVPWRRPA